MVRCHNILFLSLAPSYWLCLDWHHYHNHLSPEEVSLTGDNYSQRVTDCDHVLRVTILILTMWSCVGGDTIHMWIRWPGIVCVDTSGQWHPMLWLWSGACQSCVTILVRNLIVFWEVLREFTDYRYIIQRTHRWKNNHSGSIWSTRDQLSSAGDKMPYLSA